MPKRNRSLFGEETNIQIPRARFDLSHSRKTTMNEGDLVPLFCQPVLPGDTFEVSESKVVRSLTPLVPVMDDAFLDTFWFFVPDDILWDDFKRFMKENDSSSWVQTGSFNMPGLDLSQIVQAAYVAGGTVKQQFTDPGSLWDYLGLPLLDVDNLQGGSIGSINYINVLPFRGYKLIATEWFRNENVVQPLAVSKSSTPSFTEYYGLWQVDKFKDYFTSALPAPLKASAPVSLPLVQGDWAPVTTRANEIPGASTSGAHTGLKFRQTNGTTPSNLDVVGTTSGGQAYSMTNGTPTVHQQVFPSNLWIDLGSTSAATVNSLRMAFAMQRVYERLAVGGSRYTEYLRSFFGVLVPDAALQRPEYLGGRSTRLDMRQIPQTGATSGTSILGSTGALSYTQDRGRSFKRSFNRFGYLYCLATIRVRHSYSQGIPAHFSVRDFWDMYNPKMAFLGEVPIYNRELMVQPDVSPAIPMDGVFGYKPIYNEYRYIPNTLTGLLRPDLQNGFQAWSYGDVFSTMPTLSDTFVKENDANVAQTLAVSNPATQFLVDAYFDMKAVRPLPSHPMPGLIDHF